MYGWRRFRRFHIDGWPRNKHKTFHADAQRERLGQPDDRHQQPWPKPRERELSKQCRTPRRSRCCSSTSSNSNNNIRVVVRLSDDTLKTCEPWGCPLTLPQPPRCLTTCYSGSESAQVTCTTKMWGSASLSTSELYRRNSSPGSSGQLLSPGAPLVQRPTTTCPPTGK